MMNAMQTCRMHVSIMGCSVWGQGFGAGRGFGGCNSGEAFEVEECSLLKINKIQAWNPKPLNSCDIQDTFFDKSSSLGSRHLHLIQWSVEHWFFRLESSESQGGPLGCSKAGSSSCGFGERYEAARCAHPAGQPGVNQNSSCSNYLPAAKPFGGSGHSLRLLQLSTTNPRSASKEQDLQGFSFWKWLWVKQFWHSSVES